MDTQPHEEDYATTECVTDCKPYEPQKQTMAHQRPERAERPREMRGEVSDALTQMQLEEPDHGCRSRWRQAQNHEGLGVSPGDEQHREMASSKS